MYLLFIFTVIGWIAIANNLVPEGFSTNFGPAFAVSIFTIMYGLMTKLLCEMTE